MPTAYPDTHVQMHNSPRRTFEGRNTDAQLANLETERSRIDALLAAARPRLLRQARAFGLASDAADDIVQETLLEAWRHLDQLRSPELFEAWLSGICRNVCLRWSQTISRTKTRQIPFSSLQDPWSDERTADTSDLDIADPAALDPVEELERQDRQVLLDKALGHLPRTAREAVELYYLAELPQREVALHLGMTIHALEERLYRARRQLHQLLHTELRSDAESFGLLLDPDETANWRGTREWCHYCGRQRELGLLEFRDGLGKLQTRCPVCSHLYGDTNTSGWLPELVGMRSFRPALNRLNSHIKTYMPQALATGSYPCEACGKEAYLRFAKPGELYGYFTRVHPHYSLVLECPACKWFSSMWACGFTFWSDPVPNAFRRQHPRWIIGPEIFIEYENQPALRFCMLDTMSEARLIIIAHAQTLQVLTSYEE